MLPPLPQMYRKNIIQATKCAHPLFLLLCRGEPTGTLMRNHCSDTCCHLQRTIVHTTPEPCHPICVPSRVRFRSLSPYLRTLARTAPEPCRPICVPSRVRFRSLSPYLRTLARTGPEACRPICVPSRVRLRCLPPYLRTLARTVRTLPPLAAYLYTGFYASYRSSLHTFLIIYLYLFYKSFKGIIEIV